MSVLANVDLIVLFFFLGALASWLRSDLELPESIGKFLSIFLLLSLGLKGGHEVRTSEDPSGFVLALTLGLLSCLVIPLYFFFWLKRKLGPANAAALAASYGSVSAVTLIAAQGFLDSKSIPHSGYMVAVMAIMEIPAIALALFFFARWNSESNQHTIGDSLLKMIRAKSVVLLLGGFFIGLVMNESSWSALAPVIQGSFKGVLAFFLLGLGITAQKQLRDAWQFRWLAILVACALPLLHGAITMFLARYLGLEEGDAVLLSVLAGSASYIAAPAAISANIPSANPSLYVALPLALTFSMNVIFGIPFYQSLYRY